MTKIFYSTNCQLLAGRSGPLGLILFCLILVTCMPSCNDLDDGSFTPQEIFQDEEEPIDTTFTIEDPCLTASCAERTLSFSTTSTTNTELNVEYFSSFDLQKEAAIWGNIKAAIIVIHGNERNANEYFSWLANALISMNKQDEVVLIAPHFKLSSDTGSDDQLLFWSNDGWKRGFSSNNISSTKISSFTVVDTFINMLADKAHFPFIEKVIVTGHSAGAQYSHLHAAASPAGENNPDIELQYIVANNQYFFYPGPERFSNISNSFNLPIGCDNYTEWPFGTDNPTSYMSSFSDDEIRQRFINRPVNYLLGNLDIQTGGTLNTSDCATVLLGEHRFQRGTYMYDYLGAFHAGHAHQKFTVPNVGHNPSAMYNSTASKELIRSILN